jgi:hypothetical protein
MSTERQRLGFGFDQWRLIAAAAATELRGGSAACN